MMQKGKGMEIRPLISEDREKLQTMLRETRMFHPEEIAVAMDLIDIALKDPNQKDYRIYCAVNGQGHPAGFICFGPIPITRGAFDLYWIVVDPKYQGRKIGSGLLGFLEEEVRESKGRMILIDTSSIPPYERTRSVYLKKGYQEVARVPDFYWPGNDRITYCKRVR